MDEGIKPFAGYVLDNSRGIRVLDFRPADECFPAAVLYEVERDNDHLSAGRYACPIATVDMIHDEAYWPMLLHVLQGGERDGEK